MNARRLIRAVFGVTIVLSVTVLLADTVKQTAAGPSDKQISAVDTVNVTINKSAVTLSERTVVSVPRCVTVGAKLISWKGG